MTDLDKYLKYLEEKYDIKLEDLTCHTCKDKETCPYAYDGYNIDGDCLAIK